MTLAYRIFLFSIVLFGFAYMLPIPAPESIRIIFYRLAFPLCFLLFVVMIFLTIMTIKTKYRNITLLTLIIYLCLFIFNPQILHLEYKFIIWLNADNKAQAIYSPLLGMITENQNERHVRFRMPCPPCFDDEALDYRSKITFTMLSMQNDSAVILLNKNWLILHRCVDGIPIEYYDGYLDEIE